MIWWADIFSIKIPARRCRNVILISNCNFGDGWPTSSLTCQYKVLFFAVYFLNVTSKCLLERMHYYTGYLFCFSPLCFQPFGIAILACWLTHIFESCQYKFQVITRGSGLHLTNPELQPPLTCFWSRDWNWKYCFWYENEKKKLSELWTYPISQDDIVCWAGKSNLLNGNELIECLTHVHRLIFKPGISVVFRVNKC